MRPEDLLKMVVEVARGENHFSMDRGSFRYKQTLRDRRTIARRTVKKIAGGFRLTCRDREGKTAVTFTVKDTGTGWRIDHEGTSGAAFDRFWLTFPADPAEHIYGCGETYAKFDLKGEKVRIWVAEHQNSKRIAAKLIKEKLRGRRPDRVLPFDRYESYYAQPTYISSGRFFLHAHVDTYAEFDFTRPDRTTIYLQEPPHLTVEWAESFEALSERLTALLGRQKGIPDWAYDGAILAVQGGTKAVDAKLTAAWVAGAKICGVWSQDWCGCRRTGFGYQVMWNWAWDRELYPGLDKAIPRWREQGVRFLGYINPFLAIEKELYREAAAKGYCVKNAKGEDYLVTITTFPAAMVDFTNPAAWTWYKGIIQTNLIDLGLSGWMADFGEYLPVDAVLYDGSDPQVMHNRWPVLWARLNREAIDERGREDIFFFTRAGYTGTAACAPVMWTGDLHVDWSADDGIPSSIPATLSLAMSGVGVSHSDVGGYTTMLHMRRSRELLLRWEELCAFTPLMRFHEGNQPVNNVQFADGALMLSQLARCTRLHAGLKDYLKEAAEAQRLHGIPMTRPLFYHYDEPEAYTEKTEYLLGRDLLVAPVLRQGETARRCWLPRDEWVHLFTGKRYAGGVSAVDAPIGAPPVFIRACSPWLASLTALTTNL